jgi:small-conductance mechanosensitive channel
MNPTELFDSFSLDDVFVSKVIQAAVLVAVLMLLLRAARHLTQRVVTNPTRRYRLNKVFGRVTLFVLAASMLALWEPGTQNVFALLTVIGAGLAISMREALLSAAGWLNIVTRQPFKTGERVEINGIKGDVVDIRLMHTTLMEVGGWVDADQSTGRLVHLPNAWIFLHQVQNYTHGFRFVWHEMSVTLPADADWKRARAIINELADESAEIVAHQAEQDIKRLASEYLVHYSILTPFVYVKLSDQGIRLTLRYLCEARKRRGTEHAFTLQILDRFADEHIPIVLKGSGARIGPAAPDGDDDKQQQPQPRTPRRDVF